MKIVGFQSGHDVSYCVLENGVPVIHDEWERFSRVKMQIGDGLEFFFSKVDDCDDVKYFTFGNLGGLEKHCSTDSINKMNNLLEKNNGKYYEIGHHTSHAANAFYTSPFESALIITVDGGGWEDLSTPTALCIFDGKDKKINKLETYSLDEINLGTLWNITTREVFNLSTGYPKGDQAGTVMAMATMGQPKYTEYFSKTSPNLQKLIEIVQISEQEKFNVAASLQKFTEETFKNYISKYILNSNYENLCLSGGVSLNCVMIGKIKQWFPQIKNIFCDPIPYDAGLAMGSARYVWHNILENNRIYDQPQNVTPYLGKTYSKDMVLEAISKINQNCEIRNVEDIDVLKLIENQKIISVFGGGSESGRRALGNRSILADPRNLEMKNIINHKVKHRQWFRPFAPSILLDKVNDWFTEYAYSPYMSFAIKFKDEVKDKVPAVVHYDNTGRLQTVVKELNSWYYNFIKQWEELTGVPILLNTSFNDTEPIVETPEDAIKCFMNTNIDCLYFFDYGILLVK